MLRSSGKVKYLYIKSAEANVTPSYPFLTYTRFDWRLYAILCESLYGINLELIIYNTPFKIISQYKHKNTVL